MEGKLKYTKYLKNDLLNGTGIGCTIWLTLCTHGCVGCFNTYNQSNQIGDAVGDGLFEQVLKDLSQKHISRFTWSGGDPCHKHNRKGVIKYSRLIKEEQPDISVWLYTGYTWEEILNNQELLSVVELCDVVVDGKYNQDLKITGDFKGSSNQKVIDVQKSLHYNKIILWDSKEML